MNTVGNGVKVYHGLPCENVLRHIIVLKCAIWEQKLSSISTKRKDWSTF